MKQYVYAEPVQNREQLVERIHNAVATIDGNMLVNVQANLLRRARLCVEVGGAHFEHLL